MTQATRMMTPLPTSPSRSVGDVPAERSCLRCSTAFASEGFGHRVCPRCKNTVVWRSCTGPGPARSGRRRG
jgi:hypothetical protein